MLREAFRSPKITLDGANFKACRRVVSIEVLFLYAGCVSLPPGGATDRTFLRERRFALIGLAAVLICAGGVGLAQQPASSGPTAQTAMAAAPSVTPSPDLAGLAHVAVRVKDLDASVAFYQKLGFVEAFALSRDGKVYEAFLKINDRQFIELYPATPDHAQIGFLHVCFEGRNLQAAHDFYVAAGLKPTAVKTAGAGNLLFTMPGPATPTGPQNMEYTQYMPGSMHSKDIGQHLGPERIAREMVGVTIVVDDPVAARAFYVNQAGFLPASSDQVDLPGASREFIRLAAPGALRFASQIFFKVDHLDQANAALSARGIAFRQTASGIVVEDPDGNETIFQ
jgi:catechol 2,3-dioxygenase-like lactoylglutathione lyase family enzyme